MRNSALRFLRLLAGAGFLASAFVNLASWMKVDLGPRTMLLHIGVFVVFVPAVFMAQGLQPRRRSDWKTMLRGCPPWVPKAMGGLFAYAIVNFVLFILQTGGHPKHVADPQYLVNRGFSGHWMIFYAAACAMYWSRLNAGPFVRRCLNGHKVTADMTFCPGCGADVSTLFLTPAADSSEDAIPRRATL
jgi:hypothetical protein